MRAVVISLGFIGYARATPDYLAMWDQFKADFGKVFDTNDAVEARRFETFKSNVKYIESENSKGLSYELGVNQFADLTNEEFMKVVVGGYNPSAKRWGEELASHPFPNISADVPETVDWVAKGGVTPVKNQKSCGSCWAFSTTGSLEGALFVATQKLEPLSEEDLVQCDHSGDQGCKGGLMDNAFSWVIKNGICSEADYPYTSGGGVRGTCRSPKCTPVMTVTGHVDVPEKNEVALKKAVAQQPVSVAIEADKMAFQLYKRGVLKGTGCGTKLDHGVLIVGYGTDGGDDYWKVKNSWGPTWGEQGYIRLLRGTNECGVALQASYPTGAKALAPGPSPGPAPGPAPGSTHYGDPSDGCLSDEESVRISGVKGDVCAPECKGNRCPTDVPSGVTATPTCALRGGASDQRCALMCDPTSSDDECGEATCRPIQGLGICTYDVLSNKSSKETEAVMLEVEKTAQIIV